MHLIPDLQRAADAIAQADGLLVAAGAGMGVDSGLPDFRGTDGFWAACPALRKAGVDFQDIASPAAFRRRPRQAWGFYGHRWQMYRRIEPHAGFARLRRRGASLPRGCAVFTSNVNGQFQRAGFADLPVHDCHGSIHHLQCTGPCCAQIWPADALVPQAAQRLSVRPGAVLVRINAHPDDSAVSRACDTALPLRALPALQRIDEQRLTRT